MIVELARGPLLTKCGEWTHVLYSCTCQAIAMVYGEVAGKDELL